jgi:hypothetical protein
MEVHTGKFSSLSRIKDITGSDYAIKHDTTKMFKVRGPLQLYIVGPIEDPADVELEAFLFIEEGEYIKIHTHDFPHIFTNATGLYIKVFNGTDTETDRFYLSDKPRIILPKDPLFKDVENVFVNQLEIYNIKAGNSYVVTHS